MVLNSLMHDWLVVSQYFRVDCFTFLVTVPAHNQSRNLKKNRQKGLKSLPNYKIGRIPVAIDILNLSRYIVLTSSHSY